MNQWQSPRATIHAADARNLPIASNSVHAIVTSPPYLGLRTYDLQPAPWGSHDPRCNHRWQEHAFPPYAEKQTYCSSPSCAAWLGNYGSEPSIEEYLDHTLEIFRELARVLRRDGSLWLNLGDSYNTNQLWAASRNPHLNPELNPKRTAADPKRKDLLLMPARVALALQQDGWYVRAENIWEKPNSKPEAPTDRTRRTHEQMYILTRRPKYHYDAEAVKTPASPNTHARRKDGAYAPAKGSDPSDHRVGTWSYSYQPERVHLHSVWEIPTEQRTEQHFASFPERLAEICIMAATSEKGACPQCGSQWQRNPASHDEPDPSQPLLFEEAQKSVSLPEEPWLPTCSHDLSPVPSTVLDPFCGSGSTIAAAVKLGREAIGTDASEHYARMTAKRVSQLTIPML